MHETGIVQYFKNLPLKYIVKVSSNIPIQNIKNREYLKRPWNLYSLKLFLVNLLQYYSNV